jgi:hypothetical protein
MRNAWVGAALVVLCGTAFAGGPQERKSRPFHMGTTMMPHDMSLEGIASMLAFIKDNVDLVGRKLDDGVPWQEALTKSFYPEELEKKIAEESKPPEGKRVYLATTPLQKEGEGKAGYWGAAADEPRAAAWSPKDLDDPDVIRAYANWCRDLLRRFQPDYFAYAIGVNQFAAKHPDRWKKFVAFSKEIYVTLKKENPSLPIFVTLNAEAFYGETESAQKKMLSQLAPFSDLACVSAIPFYTQPNPAKIPKDYFAKLAATMPGKPLAVETAFIAEDMRIGNEERAGKATWQEEYLRFVLDESARLNGKFVIWMLPRDCDALYGRLAKDKNEAAEFIKIFRDTGLLDGDGKPRKSFETWSKWLALPRK